MPAWAPISKSTDAARLGKPAWEQTMSEEATAVVEPAEQEAAETEATEIDWKAQARKHEARAKENAAKAKANESAAQRLAELEEANKTAEQKAQERLAAAEARAQELEAKATLAEAAAASSIPVEVLAGPADRTPEALAAYAETLTNWRGEQKQAPSSSALGRVNNSDASLDASARAILGFH